MEIVFGVHHVGYNHVLVGLVNEMCKNNIAQRITMRISLMSFKGMAKVSDKASQFARRLDHAIPVASEAKH